MSIRVNDMDKVDAWAGGGILGPGKHEVEIGSAQEGMTRNDNPQVEIEFDALDGSGSIRDWLVFTPNSLGKARMLLDAIGIAPESGEWEFPTHQLGGKRLTIQVGLEPDYRDPSKTRNRVQAYLPAGQGDAEPAEAASVPDGEPDLPF